MRKSKEFKVKTTIIYQNVLILNMVDVKGTNWSNINATAGIFKRIYYKQNQLIIKL